MPMTMTDVPKQFGQAQWAFIKKTREAVNNDPKLFLAEHNWRNITPPGGKNDSMLYLNCNKKTTVDAFYVRPIACWVPHLLIANHVPSCPRCKTRDHVDTIKARWMNSPKILFGTTSHKYLDSMLYPCTKCKTTFSGYHKRSLQLDASVVFGYFNYYLGHGYAVDEQLFRMIVEEATTESTSAIAQRMKRLQVAEYLDQYQLYLGAVGLEKVKPQLKQQRTLTSMLPKPTGDAELDHLIRERNNCMSEVAKQRMLLYSAHVKHGLDISFMSILKDKENHNVHGQANCIPGLGGTKLRKLMACNILSTKALLEADPVDYMAYKRTAHLIPRWQRMVDSYYNNLSIQVDVYKGNFDRASAAYQEANDALIRYKDSDIARERHQQQQRRLANPYRNNGRRIQAPTTTATDDLNEQRPCLFSKFAVKTEYNGRVLSKY
jgi:hypothetical protein